MSERRIKILVVADVPGDTANAFMTYMRTFDMVHPNCHFQILADAPEHSVNEVAAMVQAALENLKGG